MKCHMCLTLLQGLLYSFPLQCLSTELVSQQGPDNQTINEKLFATAPFGNKQKLFHLKRLHGACSVCDDASMGRHAVVNPWPTKSQNCTPSNFSSLLISSDL